MPRRHARHLRGPFVAALLVALLAAPVGGAAGSPAAAAVAPQATAPPQSAPSLHTLVIRPPEKPRWVGERIDLSLRDADLVEVLRSFAKLGKFNLVVDPAVKGTVTVELEDVPWDAAMAVILRTHGLAAEVDGRIVAVSRR